MSAKRKRVVLSLIEKFEIITRLKNGETAISLAAEFNVGVSTIGDIKKSESRLLKFMTEMENRGVLNRKSMRSGKNGKLDSALYQWFSEKRREGETVTGPALCEKALEIHEKLGGNQEFKASSGWLQRFKLRHGIKVTGEHCSFENNVSKIDVINLFDDYIKKYESSKWKANQAEEPKDEIEQLKNEDDMLSELPVKVNVIETTNDSISTLPENSSKENKIKEPNIRRSGADIPSNSEALLALHTSLKWYEHQENVDTSLLTSLTRVRDIAVEKTLSNFFMLA